MGRHAGPPEQSGTTPSFTSSRHEKAAPRQWSPRTSPWPTRSSCGHGEIPPGAPHYVLTDPEHGTAVVCGACYRAPGR